MLLLFLPSYAYPLLSHRMWVEICNKLEVINISTVNNVPLVPPPVLMPIPVSASMGIILVQMVI